MLTGKQFKRAFISGANNILNHRKDVDALNVFPVPDGDTGSNMTTTVLEQQRIEHERDYDTLTGLYRRRAFDRACEALFQQPEKLGCAALLMMDLDNLKHINDTYGHAIGDTVIRTLADLMKKHTAGRGYAGRWGGDEFLIILPGSTLETAETLSIHMKDDLLHAHVLPDDSPVSASFGVTIARPGELEQSFYKRVDNALYTSKENGKNRITIFDANGTAKALTLH